MKFLIVEPEETTTQLACVNKNKKRIRLKYNQGYAKEYIGKVCCELQEDHDIDGARITFEDKEITLDWCELDFLRKVLNLHHQYVSNPWLTEEQRKENIYKLKKGKV